MTDLRQRPPDRDLWLFYAFRLLATSYLYVPIFMLFQDARGLARFDQFALGGVYSATIVVAEVPTGVFADRFGRRISMLIGALAMVASCLLALAAHDFVAFVVVEILAALSMSLCSGADSAYLYDLLAATDRRGEYPRRESIASAWHLVGTAVAVAVGGVVAEVDLALPYLITAAVAAAAAVIAWQMREPARPANARSSARWWSACGVALGEVARNGRLTWLVLYSSLVFVLLRATVYVYQPYLAERGLSLAEIGAIYAGIHIVAASCSARTYALRRRFGDGPVMWALLGVLAISYLGLAGVASGDVMLALLVVQAIATGIYSPLTKPLLNREITDANSRAAILSVESMARRAAMMVFAPLLGLSGTSVVMAICGGVGLAGMAVLAALLTRGTVPD